MVGMLIFIDYCFTFCMLTHCSWKHVTNAIVLFLLRLFHHSWYLVNLIIRNELPNPAHTSSGKTMTWFCLPSHQVLLPAFVFIGLEEDDCCGCCGRENYGKRCTVSLLALPPSERASFLMQDCGLLLAFSLPRCFLLYWLLSLALQDLATASLWQRWVWQKDQSVVIPTVCGTTPLPTLMDSM